jgi:hypothetical protein
MSCHGFFDVGHKEFGKFLITGCTIAANKTTPVTELLTMHTFFSLPPVLCLPKPVCTLKMAEDGLSASSYGVSWAM